MKLILSLTLVLLLTAFGISKFFPFTLPALISGAPPYDPGGGNVSDDTDFSWLTGWSRPEGPAKVALQVGHWKNDEVPEELEKLIGNTGATGGGKSEWEVNHEIAMLTKDLLEERGIIVDVLPTTIPPKFWADVFVAIHADGSETSAKSGFKVAGPRRDYSGNKDELIASIEKSYASITGLVKDPNITRNMTGYYAFSWWRYEHAIHPMTTSAILETGFLTSPTDRTIIVNNPELSAQGLAEGIIEYLESQKLIS